MAWFMMVQRKVKHDPVINSNARDNNIMTIDPILNTLYMYFLWIM